MFPVFVIAMGIAVLALGKRLAALGAAVGALGTLLVLVLAAGEIVYQSGFVTRKNETGTGSQAV